MDTKTDPLVVSKLASWSHMKFNRNVLQTLSFRMKYLSTHIFAEFRRCRRSKSKDLRLKCTEIPTWNRSLFFTCLYLCKFSTVFDIEHVKPLLFSENTLFIKIHAEVIHTQSSKLLSGTPCMLLWLCKWLPHRILGTKAKVNQNFSSQYEALFMKCFYAILVFEFISSQTAYFSNKLFHAEPFFHA